ncbi:MAG: efflux RND transporter permease subunit [Phycisphaeraceae bacterium]|nr:MAG: efflux RND transporter permease subunit [Phycisphaeraceae bacterium]
MNLPRLCVSRPITTMMIASIVVIIGAFSLTRLPIDLLPDVTLPSLTIRSQYDNASPEEMERLVTEPIEAAVSLVSGIEELVSTSAEGVSNVRVRFVWGTDLEAASNEIRDRLDRIMRSLPEDMDRPNLRKFDISASPIVLLGVASPLDPIDLTQLLDTQILYRLERLPGVAVVDVWGSFTREIRVELDLERLKALNLSIDAVIEALREANISLPGGEIEAGRQRISVRTPGEFESIDQIASTVVAMRERGPVRLSDIADILDTHQDISRIIRIDGERGVRLAVRKQSDANTAEVSSAVLREVERINAAFPQLSITPVIDQGQFIERSIANVGRSILYGGGLAVLVLLFFLRSVRSTIVIAVSIPISVVATFALIYIGGYTLNLMTLGGLALGIGMMVDNSIVVLENIYRRRHEDREQPAEASVRGAGEVATAIIASTTTTLVIFLPLVFTRGVSGVLFQQFALVVAFSLLVSLAVALTVVPMLSSRLIGAAGEPASSGAVRSLTRAADGFFDGLERLYLGLLRDALRFRFVTVLLAAGLLGASFLLVPMLGSEFLPPSDEGEVRVSGEMEVGTRLDLVDRQTKLLESLVFPAVPEMVTGVVSVGASGWNPADASEGEIRMALTPASQRTRSNTEIADDLRERLEGQIPGMRIRTRAPQGQRMLERLLGGEEGLDIEVRGYELSILDALVAEAGAIIEQTPGVTDIRLSREIGVPQELVRIDRDKAADLGVSVRSIAQTLEAALGGARAGEFREAGEEHRILVRLKDARRIPLDEILDITVRSSNGEDVALRNLVTASGELGPLVIDRKNQQRIARISANISGRDLVSVASDVRERLQSIPRPVGYEFVIAGSYEEQQRAFREMLFTFALAIALVYMVLASQYESFRDPLVVMLSVPTAAIGVIVILFLTGTTLNIQTYIGCIMLGGIVVNNAILLVDQAGRLRREQGMNANDALLEAGRRRLRPILMTSMTTILALIPLAMGVGEGAEAQAPLARAVIGGLTFSTLVTLVLVPAVYSMAHPDRSESAA